MDDDQISLFEAALEERADFIPENDLREETADSEFFGLIRGKLLERGAKLIVGPRGCGKTHLMRYTWLDCKENKALPLAVYVSFTRYVRLEPLLKQNTNAIALFHSWVLSKIIIACTDLLDEPDVMTDFCREIVGENPDTLRNLIAKLERGMLVDEYDQRLAASISISQVMSSLDWLINKFSRRRAIILLDDAALSLTPDYLIEFFDIFRSLKSARISPKASVYPGTTDYGPRFNVRHDAEPVEAWLAVEDKNYSNIMGSVARARLKQFEEIPEELSELLKYAAFGIPRVYLMMLRSYSLSKGRTSQQSINKTIQDQASQLEAEYESLKVKVPQFSTIIITGQKLFHNIVTELTAANKNLSKGSEKALIVGIERDHSSPTIERMFQLLIEAGLLYPLPSVSHGPDRTYLRYIPHLAALIEKRAFSGNSRGFSSRSIIDFLHRKSIKHPIRRKLSSLLSNNVLDSLRLDLPQCQNCGAGRLSESQKFCHECGSQLVEESIYKRCMKVPLDDVPGIRNWQKTEIKRVTKLKTIGDLLTIQDPASELRKGNQIGKVRATEIFGAVESFVDEFLS